MDLAFAHERTKIDKANKKVQTCSLEEAENNKALQYEFEPLSETQFKNRKLYGVIHKELSPKQRMAFLLYYMGNYNMTEIAALMGITKQTAQKHISLALEKIHLKEADILKG